jgi:hypothetical protein
MENKSSKLDFCRYATIAAAPACSKAGIASVGIGLEKK